MNRKRIYTGAAVSLLLFFAACDMMGPESGPIPAPPEGKAAVLVRIAAAGIPGRTVAPDVVLQDVTAWELWGGKQGDTETLLVPFSGVEGTTVYLDPGVWYFTLTGYQEEDVILSGTIPQQTISSTGTNNLHFTVDSVLEGQGTLRITINLPEGSGITTARIFKDGTALEPSGGSPVTAVDNRIVFEGEYTGGDYYFSFQLYNGNDLYGVISEIVQVRANLQSEKTYTLTLEDLDRTYIITYHLMDGETEAEPGYYRYTDPAVSLISPSPRENYVFAGWYDKADWSGDAVTVVPAGSLGDKDFYARWTAYYTVTFDADGGSPETETRMVLRDGPIGEENMPSNPTKPGSVFGGWYTERNGGGSQIMGAAIVTGNLTVYAKWTAYYTVTFDADGGSPEIETRTVLSGDSVGEENMPSNPAKPGFVFGGWYTGQYGGGTLFTGTTPVTGTMTVYAQWTVANAISDITYGDTWTLLADGRRQSPPIGPNAVAKARVSFTSNVANTSIIIQLDVSSEAGFDFAFISTLDDPNATYNSGNYMPSISGTQSVTVTIPVQNPGNHFIEVGYRKDAGVNSGSDCAWFKVIEPAPVSIHVQVQPVSEVPPLDNASFFGNQEAQFSAGSGYASYAWYLNGTLIVGADSPTYTLPAGSKPSGIYELSVIVTSSAGERFSARCRVVIKDY